MNFNPPKNLKILSDNNEIQLLKIIPSNKNQKEVMFRYVFIKSICKLGMEVSFTESELKKQMCNFFKSI